MNRTTRHLDSQELTSYIALQEREVVEDSIQNQDILGHLNGCTQCRLRLLRLIAGGADETVKQLNEIPSSNPPCPPITVWAYVSNGDINSKQSLHALQHAATCSSCSISLTAALDEIEETEEEAKLLATTNAFSAQSSQQLAETLATAPRREKKTRSSLWSRTLPPHLWIWTTMTTAAIILLTVSYRLLFVQPPVEKLLEEAYTQARSTELRLPGADYAPLSIVRGEERTNIDIVPLAEAKAQISRNLQKHPEDPRWLKARATEGILEHTAAGIEDSISILERLKTLEPQNVDTLNRLGAAYTILSELQNSPEDLIHAEQLLSSAYQANPRDKEVLFNYALVLEKLYLYNRAIEVWTEYLKLDSGSKWAEEARAHLDRVRKIQNDHRNSKNNSPPDSEQMLDSVVREFLPELASDSKQNSTDFFSNLKQIAILLNKQHKDPWLLEFLHSPSPHGLRGKAAILLSKSFQENAEGSYQQAEQDARLAAISFRKTNNLPGYARAEFERVYSLHRLWKPAECNSLAKNLLRIASTRAFRWIEVQALIELSICQTMERQLSQGNQTLSEAEALAAQTNYRALQLRILGIKASNASEEQENEIATKMSLKGLGIYWDNAVAPPQRAFMFYDALGMMADQDEDWPMAFDFEREAALTLANTNLVLPAAVAWTHEAQSAFAIGRLEESSQALALSNRLLSGITEEHTRDLYTTDNNIWMARLQLAVGDSKVARTTLAKVSTFAESASIYTVSLPYHIAAGQVSIIDHDWSTSRKHLEKARTLAIQALTNIHSYGERLFWQRRVGEIYHSLVELTISSGGNLESAAQLWQEYISLLKPSKAPAQSKADFPVKANARLHIVVLREKIALFLQMKDGKTEFAWSPTTADKLLPLQRRYLLELSSPSTTLTAIKKDGFSLYKALLEPVAPYLSENDLVIVRPDRSIGDLPFSTLVLPTGEYAISHFNFAISEGHSGFDLAEAPPLNSKALEVSAETIPKMSSLGSLDKEGEALLAAYPKTKVLRNNSISIKVIEQELANAHVLHFAGHALHGEGLSLNNNSLSQAMIMGPSDISKLQMPALELAVLSACTTSQSKDGIRSDRTLTGALLSKNVRFVLASRWQIDSVATTELMSEFYQALAKERSPPKALRNAELSFFKGKYQPHPYYWSAFDVFLGST